MEPDEREWLETNGLGGFAMSTVSGINTRRYHGLLTAALQPPTKRHLLLSKYEEVLWVGLRQFPLSANYYPGTVHPEGFKRMTSFRMDPGPVFRYEAGGAVLEKRVRMLQGQNAVIVEWELLEKPDEQCLLTVRPLIAFRDYHSTTHKNDALRPHVDIHGDTAIIHPYTDLPELHFKSNAASVKPTGQWYLHFQYPREQERGLEYEEDLFCPFEAAFELDRMAVITASVGPAEPEAPAVASKHRAADQFIVTREGGRKSIIAGYPWFTDWGRDTMIALPGLTLATGRYEDAKSILNTFAEYVDGGMIPNRFPDSGEAPEYNTVDGSLWYFEAVQKYIEATGDREGMEVSVFPALRKIIEGYRAGTRYGIREDEDGLIEAGPQLTWMDTAATPRAGKAVEIQALWYNALRIMGEDDAAAHTKASFDAKFWNAEQGCYFDLLGDASIRPNQILAMALTYPIAEPEHATRVFALVSRELLTPVGLRTLAPLDPKYIGRYEGGPEQRDRAYHQGTVWPWLIGLYLDSARNFGFETGEVTGSLSEYMDGPGCGQLPEIFDGDAPHQARGCIAQAWSVAAFVRYQHG